MSKSSHQTSHVVHSAMVRADASLYEVTSPPRQLTTLLNRQVNLASFYQKGPIERR